MAYSWSYWACGGKETRAAGMTAAVLDDAGMTAAVFDDGGGSDSDSGFGDC